MANVKSSGDLESKRHIHQNAVNMHWNRMGKCWHKLELAIVWLIGYGTRRLNRKSTVEAGVWSGMGRWKIGSLLGGVATILLAHVAYSMVMSKLSSESDWWPLILLVTESKYSKKLWRLCSDLHDTGN